MQEGAVHIWEAITPVPSEKDAPGEDDPNPRRTRAEAEWRELDGLLPHMKAMHEFSADHISEDIELQAIDFSSYLLEWLIYAPVGETTTFRMIKAGRTPL